MFHDVAQQNLLQSIGFVQEISLATGKCRHLFKVRPVHVLAKANGRNCDLIIGRLARKLQAVAFF